MSGRWEGGRVRHVGLFGGTGRESWIGKKHVELLIGPKGYVFNLRI